MKCLVGRLVARRSVLRVLLLSSGFLGTRSSHADLPDRVEQLKPSVILVGTYCPTDSPRFTFRGTGFVVGAGSRAITNVHVLPELTSTDAVAGRQLAIQVWNSSPGVQWNWRLAKVEARDSANDLALLGFEGVALAPVQLSIARPREGAAIAFMGFPIGGALGYSHVTHRGIISSIAAMALPAATSQQLNERAVTQLRRGNHAIYQLDATAYPGNSGGPVFNPDTGEVIGVINSVLIKGARESALSQPSGISYVIPIEFAAALLATAVAN